jgi:16S rRNA G1207 methylase RsmC
MRPLKTSWGEFKLNCDQDERNSLQAWNQADCYLLKIASELDLHNKELIIINDVSGALTLSLQKHTPLTITDSATSQYWITENSAHSSWLTILKSDALETLKPKSPLNCFFRIPKNLHYFEYQLYYLAKLKPEVVYLSGMQKHLNKSFYETAHKYFDRVEVLPAEKKAKCIKISCSKNSPVSFIAKEKFEFRGDIFESFPNVFSGKSLDIGTRFLLDNLEQLNLGGKVLDLGCGNGILGITAMNRLGSSFCYFMDESYFATLSTEHNLKASGIDSRCYKVLHSHQIPSEIKDIDSILCNPPFHLEHVVSTHIANNMIIQSKQALASDGILYLIGNRHLAYDKALKKHFNHVSRLAENTKFIIFSATNRD